MSSDIRIWVMVMVDIPFHAWPDLWLGESPVIHCYTGYTLPDVCLLIIVIKGVEADRNSFSFSAPKMGYLVIFGCLHFGPKMNGGFHVIFHFCSKNVIFVGPKCSVCN